MILRRQPEDFRVEERLAASARAAVRGVRGAGGGLKGAGPAGHPWAVYRLTKTGMTTPEACAALAKALGAPASSVAYAGLKDKHAVTVQHVAVLSPGRAMPEVSGRGWSAALVGHSAFPITSEWIERNEFTIVARGVSAEVRDRIEARVGALTSREPGAGEPSRAGRVLSVVSYFGDQRFGSARHGRGFAARALFAGDVEGALRLLIGTPARKDTGPRRTLTRVLAARWGDFAGALAEIPARGVPERGAVELLARGGGMVEAYRALPAGLRAMVIDAYQAHLWNRVAARVVRSLADTPGLWASPGLEGEMVFVAWASVPEALRTLSIPTLSPASVLDEADAGMPEGERLWRRAAREVLEVEGLKPEQLRAPALGVEPRSYVRALFMPVERFHVEDADEGGAARFAFALPRGCFATVVLRAVGGSDE